MKYAPALFGLATLLIWEAAVRITGVPSYLIPGPSAIIAAFLADPFGLLLSLASTL
jgi:NitT/TauT family transport system permease protein